MLDGNAARNLSDSEEAEDQDQEEKRPFVVKVFSHWLHNEEEPEVREVRL